MKMNELKWKVTVIPDTLSAGCRSACAVFKEAAGIALRKETRIGACHRSVKRESEFHAIAPDVPRRGGVEVNLDRLGWSRIFWR